MSLTLQIDLSDTATPWLARFRDGLADGQGLHDAMGFAVGAGAREHLNAAGYVGRVNALGGKSTGFWRSVANSITSEATADSATVTYSHRGIRLRYFGGTVKPVTRKALSVPVHKSAHGLNASEYPGKLAFIPAGKQFGPFRTAAGQETVGYLVRGVEQRITRGPNAGQTRIVPLPKGQGDLIYVLRKQTYHEPDPGILPKDEALLETAKTAAVNFIDAAAEN